MARGVADWIRGDKSIQMREADRRVRPAERRNAPHSPTVSIAPWRDLPWVDIDSDWHNFLHYPQHSKGNSGYVSRGR